MKLLASDFMEIGKSGKKYNKANIASSLVQEVSFPQVSITDFEVKILTGNFLLATYKTIHNSRSEEMVFRSSIWEWKESLGWILHFHQGTKVSSNNGT